MSAVLQVDERERLGAHLRRSRNDPAYFVKNVLGVTPRKWQREAWDRIGERCNAGDPIIKVLVRTCHGAGKTFFAAATLLWLMTTRKNSRGLTTAPTWLGVEKLLWPEISKLYLGSIFDKLRIGRLLGTEIHFNRGGWFAIGAASDHPQNLEGQHSDVAMIRIVDEAKAVDQEVFDSTKGCLDAPLNIDLWISTPSIETGAFYERDLGDDASVIRLVVDVDDLIADGLDTKISWKDECERDWGVNSAEYQSRVMARYIDNAEGALFPSSWIERAMNQTFEGSDRWPRVAGMDVAGSVDGDQNAVAVAGSDGDRIELLSLEAWHERDTMKSAGRLIDIRTRYKAESRVDTIGIGKGVCDFTQSQQYRASDRARDAERFSNRKAEDGWGLRRRLEAGTVAMGQLPDKAKQALKSQMRAMKYEILQTGKLRVVDPEDSPDLSDAVVIASARSRVGFTTTNVEGI